MTIRAIVAWLIHQIYPQQNLCHACQRALYGAQLWLCEPCERRFEDCRLKERMQIITDISMPITSLSPLQMTGTAKKLVHRLKFRSDKTAAKPLAEAMVAIFSRDVGRRYPMPDVIVAVPSSARKHRIRGYNQAEILAQAMSLHLGIPYQERALKRIRQDRSQVGKTQMERIVEMSQAFDRGDQIAVSDLVVLLVDDVITTGATIRACSNVLLEGGALQVIAITACRT